MLSYFTRTVKPASVRCDQSYERAVCVPVEGPCYATDVSCNGEVVAVGGTLLTLHANGRLMFVRQMGFGFCQDGL